MWRFFTFTFLTPNWRRTRPRCFLDIELSMKQHIDKSLDCLLLSYPPSASNTPSRWTGGYHQSCAGHEFTSRLDYCNLVLAVYTWTTTEGPELLSTLHLSCLIQLHWLSSSSAGALWCTVFITTVCPTYIPTSLTLFNQLRRRQRVEVYVRQSELSLVRVYGCVEPPARVRPQNWNIFILSGAFNIVCDRSWPSLVIDSTDDVMHPWSFDVMHGHYKF